MTREELRDYVEEQRNLGIIPYHVYSALIDGIDTLEQEPKTENKGEWIYDKSINNWRCSKCGQTPPPTGYVGKAEFMATHFKFCNYCGADMRGET